MHHWAKRTVRARGAAAAHRLPVGAGQVHVRPDAEGRTAASSSIIAARSCFSCRRTRGEAEPWNADKAHCYDAAK